MGGGGEVSGDMGVWSGDPGRKTPNMSASDGTYCLTLLLLQSQKLYTTIQDR